MELLNDFPLKDIIITDEFRNAIPGTDKLARREKAYTRSGELPKDIVINDSNILIDGYITYLLALKHEITALDVYRGYVEVIEARHKPGNRSYMWRLPLSLCGTVSKGDKVIVRTSAGVRRATVENVIRQQYPIQQPRLKMVCKKCLYPRPRLYSLGRENRPRISPK